MIIFVYLAKKRKFFQFGGGAKSCGVEKLVFRLEKLGFVCPRAVRRMAYPRNFEL